MPDVNVYKVVLTLQDKAGNDIATAETSAHTTEHHNDHGGTQSQSWTDHIHSIVKSGLHSAWEHASDITQCVAVYKSITFVKREFSPHAKAYYNVIYRYFKQARRA